MQTSPSALSAHQVSEPPVALHDGRGGDPLQARHAAGLHALMQVPWVHPAGRAPIQGAGRTGVSLLGSDARCLGGCVPALPSAPPSPLALPRPRPMALPPPPPPC
jgi:hypothetical protein